MLRATVAASTLAILSALPLAGAQAQDAAAGQRVFAQCRACHAVPAADARNMVGPNLYNVVGRQAGQVQGFRYSANMTQLAQGGLTWDEANLRRYLANPKDVVPQGTMAFPGIRNEQQLTDLIAYLKSVSPGS